MNVPGMQLASLPVRKPKQTGLAPSARDRLLRCAATRNEIIHKTVVGNIAKPTN
jgi:hypothetical protein